MNSENKVCKYELSKALKLIGIYYGIYFFVAISIKVLSCFFEKIDGRTIGTDLCTILWVGIIGLTILKPAFNFAQGNNISRKKFIKGTIKCGVFLSLVVAAIDLIVKFILNQVSQLLPYSLCYNWSLFEKIYEEGRYLSPIQNMFMDYLFKFGACLLVYMICLCISTAYFKMSVEKKRILVITISVIFFVVIAFDFVRFTVRGLIGNNYIVEPLVFILLSISLMTLEIFISKDMTESSGKTKKNTKVWKFAGGILIVIAALFIYLNNSNGYTYIKYNEKLYIITGETSEEVGAYLGKVENRGPKFLKPLMNNQSNGFPIGTELYYGGIGGISMADKQTEYIYAKFDNKYWYLYNVETLGPLNGYEVKIENGKVKLE